MAFILFGSVDEVSVEGRPATELCPADEDCFCEAGECDPVELDDELLELPSEELPPPCGWLPD